jgi:hypothetical protein
MAARGARATVKTRRQRGVKIGRLSGVKFGRRLTVSCQHLRDNAGYSPAEEWIGVVRCDTRRPPNEGGNATLFTCVRFESGQHSVWYSTVVELLLSADGALLFRSVRPFHHWAGR